MDRSTKLPWQTLLVLIKNRGKFDRIERRLPTEPRQRQRSAYGPTAAQLLPLALWHSPTLVAERPGALRARLARLLPCASVIDLASQFRHSGGR
jgi:hypothetical protein